MRIVLDTNVLVSGFFFGGVPGRILSAWRDGHTILVVSRPILVEYREVGRELESRYGGSDFEAFAALLTKYSEMVDAPESLDVSVCADPDDDKFLSCALYRASDFPGHLTGVSWWGPEDRRSGDGELNVVG